MPIPDKNFTKEAAYVGHFVDPYMIYLGHKPVYKYLANLVTDKDYGLWDFYGDMAGNCKTITDLLAPRDGSGVVSEDPNKGPADFRGAALHWDKAYFPNRDYRDDLLNPVARISPAFWNPITDIFSMWEVGAKDFCRKLEIKALDCVEYYGIRQGQKACSDYHDDFMECRTKRMRNLRSYAIFLEQNKRWIEYKKGLRDYDTIYKPNPKAHVLTEPYRRMGDHQGPEPYGREYT